MNGFEPITMFRGVAAAYQPQGGRVAWNGGATGKDDWQLGRPL